MFVLRQYFTAMWCVELIRFESVYLMILEPHQSAKLLVKQLNSDPRAAFCCVFVVFVSYDVSFLHQGPDFVHLWMIMQFSWRVPIILPSTVCSFKYKNKTIAEWNDLDWLWPLLFQSILNYLQLNSCNYLVTFSFGNPRPYNEVVKCEEGNDLCSAAGQSDSIFLFSDRTRWRARLARVPLSLLYIIWLEEDRTAEAVTAPLSLCSHALSLLTSMLACSD